MSISKRDALGLLATFTLVCGLLWPAIHSARQAARKAASQNNLRQIGLALYNYHDTYKSLPPGAFTTASKDGDLGWTFLIYPFMEASPFYHQVDTDHAWDSIENRYRFKQPMRVFLNPSVSEEFTSTGDPLIHYMVNPAFMHRNGSRPLQSAKAGTAHAWLAGEIAGDYQPWGYPFNWRELTAPLNAMPSSYGRPTKDGALFLLADGSAKCVANDVDPEVLAMWTANPPLPELSLRQRPDRQFNAVRRAAGYEWKRHDIPESLGQYGGNLQVAAFHSPGRVEFVELTFGSKFHERGFGLRDVVFARNLYPGSEELMLPIELTDEAAGVLSEMKLLRRLRVEKLKLSSAGIQALSRIRTLRVVKIDADALSEFDREQIHLLRSALPLCEVRYDEDRRGP